tara:strand:+ start:83 stop:274 length:192 start_codon:yes stop_codon:yes gene_type:complete
LKLLQKVIKKKIGATDGARTHDNRNHNPGLYQLSYSRRNTTLFGVARIIHKKTWLAKHKFDFI